jgi:hypothetical protein
MDAVSLEPLDADFDGEVEEATPWYEPGLLRRIGRRVRRERPKRVSLRERMRARGLHWSTELVVGIFVAVLAAALATIAVVDLGNGGASSLSVPSHDAPGAAAQGTPLPTAPCVAAPIPGSPLRPCTH